MLQHLQARRQAKSASRALWIEKSNSALCKANGSSTSASIEAQVVSDCKTTPTPHKVQLRSSREAKGKALLSATSEAAAASLSAEKAMSCGVRAEALTSANNEATSLEGKVLYSSAKALSAQIASPCGEAIVGPKAHHSSFDDD